MKRTSLMMSALALVVSASVGFTVADHDHELCNGFVPENDMKIPVGSKFKNRMGQMAASGLTEAQFNKVLDRVESLFADDVTTAGGRLRINRKWNDATVNASAQQFGNSWIINMYGGLARHPEITIEGFALVACHELGHHMGGAPKVNSWWGDAWATNEGGADYYSTLKCLRTFFSEDDNEAIIAERDVDSFAKETCEKQFTDRKDQLLCMRNSLAGDSVAGLFMDLRKETTRPRFNTPDKRQVSTTDDNHPATQCRMDTYFAGAICNVDVSEPLSDSDYRVGACSAEKHELGLRPRCWFKPD